MIGLVWFLCLMAYQPSWVINAKAIFPEEQRWCYLTHSWGDNGVHTFPNGICLKVNVIVRLEFELATTIPQSSVLTITPQGHSPVSMRTLVRVHQYILIIIPHLINYDKNCPVCTFFKQYWNLFTIFFSHRHQNIEKHNNWIKA